MKLRKTILFILVLVFSGCTTNNSGNLSQQLNESNLEFMTHIQVKENNEVEISLQMISQQRNLEADPDFNAKMELFTENNELRAEAFMPENPNMKKGKIYQVFTWRGELEPGTYQLNWFAKDYEGTRVTFDVVKEASGRLTIGNTTGEIN